MGWSLPAADTRVGFPRYFKIGMHRLSAYKVFLCVGIYTGTLVSAAVAQHSGISPLLMGVGCVSCALVGMAGARMFHLIVFARRYAEGRFWREAWNPASGGWSAFGGLVIVPFSFVLARWLDVPVAVYWDHMICGIVALAVCGRFGCIFNGCCGGKQTSEWYGVCLHDTHGTRRRRIPVQSLEIGWWLPAGAGTRLVLALFLSAGILRVGCAGLVWPGTLLDGAAARAAGRRCGARARQSSGGCATGARGGRHAPFLVVNGTAKFLCVVRQRSSAR